MLSGYSDLELATFVLKAWQARGQFEPEILHLLSEIQDEINFETLINEMVRFNQLGPNQTVKAKSNHDLFMLIDHD
jgi:hypothetical protein